MLQDALRFLGGLALLLIGGRMLVSAAKGRGELALGNVVGANICNMALVLGMCALIRPLVVQERLIRVKIWLNAAIVGMLALLGLTAGFRDWQAGVMLGVFGAYSAWSWRRCGPRRVRRSPSSRNKPPPTWPAASRRCDGP